MSDSGNNQYPYLDNLSNEDLQHIANGNMDSVSDDGLRHIVVGDTIEKVKNSLPHASQSILDNVKAVTMHALNSFTGDNLPEISASINSLIPGNPDALTLRNQYAKELQNEAIQSPIGAQIGKGVGMAGQVAALSPLSAAAPAVGVGDRMLSAAGQGAIASAIQNPGRDESTISPQLYERGKNALIGGAISGGIQGISEGANKIGGSLSDNGESLYDAAKGRLLNQAGARKSDLNHIPTNQKDDLADYIQQNPEIIKAKDTGEKVSVANDLVNSARDDWQNVYDKIKNYGAKINPDDVINGLDSLKNNDQYVMPSLKDKYSETIDGIITDVKRAGSKMEDPSYFNKFIGNIDSQIKSFNKDLYEAGPGQAASKVIRSNMRGYLNNFIDDLGNSVNDPNLGVEMIQANKQFNNALNLKDITEAEHARAMGRNWYSPSDMFIGGGAAIAHMAAHGFNPASTIPALAVGAGSTAVKRYLVNSAPQIGMSSANAMMDAGNTLSGFAQQTAVPAIIGAQQISSTPAISRRLNKGSK